MTLITSFSAFGGVAICADSQETVADYAKRKVNKIHDFQCNTGSYAIAGAGAGPYVDMLAARIHAEIENETDFGPEAIIGKVLHAYYSEHVWPCGDKGSEADIELAIAAKPKDIPVTLLFHTYRTAVNRIEDFKNIGVGRYLADYLFDRLLTPGGDIYHMLAVAVYVHKEVRENIEGVGKETNIVLYQANGELLYLWPQHVRELEEIAEGFDFLIKHQFHDLTNFGHNSTVKPHWHPDSFNPPLGRIRERMEQFVKDYEDKKHWKTAFDKPWHGIVG